MVVAETDCIVHNRRFLSKFHGTVNQLRRSNEFSNSVLQQLLKRCCSCNGRKGESSFSFDHLHEVCNGIQLPTKTSPVKPKSIDHLTLAFPSTFGLRQRHYKTGLFIGKGGKNIRSLEKEFNARLNILTDKSRKHLTRLVRESQEKNETKSPTDLWILITLKGDQNEQTSMEKVKDAIEDQWKRAVILPTKTYSRDDVVASVPLASDDRWKPKQHKNKKYQLKRFFKQQQEIEVPPQPFVRH